MILRVQPAQSLRGAIRLPASKSYSIRAFIIAACGGQSRIIHPSLCDDAKVALRVARVLGANVKVLKDMTFLLHARPGTIKKLKINVGESGTVLRFLVPLLCVSSRQRELIISGEGTLVGRPNRHLLDSLRANGIHIHGTGPKESVPILLKEGHLPAGRIHIDGSLSSQFVSSLLIACSRLEKASHIFLNGETLVSTDYIQMTQLVLREAGIRVKQISRRHYEVPGKSKFKGLKNFAVPSDYGLAAFVMAAAALVPSDVVLTGVFKERFVQADGKILQFFHQMGIKWQRRADTISMKGPFELRGGTFSLKDCPDLVPIMAVLGLFAKGGIRLTDIGHARAKESDRISDLRQELLKIGARVSESPGTLKVFPLNDFKPGVKLNPHCDHRLAMAFAVLGIKTGLVVEDIQCVKKSYPFFVRDMKTLQAPFKLAQ